MQEILLLKKQLNKLVELLKSEKEALIKNDGPTVAEIVDKKMSIMEELEKMDMESIGKDEVTARLVHEIQELQETNLLLTKQALKYHENLMESIVANIGKAGTTYSNDGGYSKQEPSGFVDQKV